tara:strand:- start:295 stop:531 length:237 start_codon:yes stop_codon:yes gene_type:complete
MKNILVDIVFSTKEFVFQVEYVIDTLDDYYDHLYFHMLVQEQSKRVSESKVKTSFLSFSYTIIITEKGWKNHPSCASL